MSHGELILSSEAARILDRSASAVRYYEEMGLLPATRTSTGVRLFVRADVEKLAKELRAKDEKRERRQ